MKKSILSLCTLSLLAACSTPAIKDTVLIQETALSEAQNSQQSPQQAIESARAIQVNAQQQDLYIYSPTYMAQAEKEITNAENALKQNKPASVTIAHSLTAQALFKRGLATKEIVIDQLKPSFDGLEMLKKIDSHTLLKDDFDDLKDDINDLILLIEGARTNKALKDQNDVLADITELEVKTLKVAHFLPAENALEQAEDADAEKFAAKTFETAEKAVEQLELLIENKYKQRELIAHNSRATIRLAQHAEQVAKAAKPLLKMDTEQAEEHILYVESLLDRVTKALDHEAVNHMPLNHQSIALAQAVERLNKQAQTNMNNSQWSNEKKELENAIAELKQAVQASSTAKTVPNDTAASTAAPKENALKSVSAKMTTPAATDESKLIAKPKPIDNNVEAAQDSAIENQNIAIEDQAAPIQPITEVTATDAQSPPENIVAIESADKISTLEENTVVTDAVITDKDSTQDIIEKAVPEAP